ncbi:MAG: hypothetical protein PUG54_05990 [Firmicutes bacterium]|nr:hypothetical protein [Bacillota bacterium]
MTLEGCMVLPIFLFFMMTVMLSIETVRFQSHIQEALYQAGNERAFSEYRVKYQGKTKVNSQEQIKEYLESQLYPYLCVKGGKEGIRFQDLSVTEQGKIEYVLSCRIKPFIEWLPIGDVVMNDRFFSHSWIGYSKIESQDGNVVPEIYVYVTRTGSRYHMSYECTHLNVQVHMEEYENLFGLRNQSGGKYYACERCKPLAEGTVYITNDGDCYHGQADCSSLKRTICMIPLSEAAGYSPCSKCAGKKERAF